MQRARSAAMTMAWRTFDFSLVALGAWLRRHRSGVQTSLPARAEACTEMPGDFPVLAYPSLIKRTDTERLIGIIRAKLGWPMEVFDSAVQPVIKGYAEYVQLLPAASDEAPPGTLLAHTFRVVLRTLDYRRGQILPRGAPPEVIGSQMHRWTYAVFIAALLSGIDSAMAELAVTIWCRDGRNARWTPRLGSMHECGACSYRVERTNQGAAATAPTGELSLVLLDRLVPPAALDWLKSEPEPMRELRDLLAGDMTREVGVIGALVLAARRGLRPVSASDVRMAACGQANDHLTPVPPADPKSADHDQRNESPARERYLRVDAPAEGESEASFVTLATVAAGGDSAPIRSHAVIESPLPPSSPQAGPASLEDFEGHHSSPSPQPILRATVMQASPSGSAGKSPSHPPVALRARGPSPEANRFMDWVQAGLAGGTLPFNERGAMVHFVPEGMLLVSPRIFTDYATRCGGLILSGGGSVEIGKVIQREVLRASFHVRGHKGTNILTYQVMRGGKPVSRLSGVVICSPERFVTPVPRVNPLLIRLSATLPKA